MKFKTYCQRQVRSHAQMVNDLHQGDTLLLHLLYVLILLRQAHSASLLRGTHLLHIISQKSHLKIRRQYASTHQTIALQLVVSRLERHSHLPVLP